MSHKELRREAEQAHAGKVHRMLGGHVDKAADEKMIRKAIGEHDTQMHGGKHTRLKFADGGKVDNDKPAERRDRRAKGGAAKHKGAHVNVIVAPQIHPGMGAAMGGPPAAPPMGPPPAPPMMPPHPMPPPGAPMPGGAPGGMAGGPPIGAMAPRLPPQPMGATMGMPPRKRGGKVAEVSMDDGAGGGEGRLEKIKAYGKNADMGEERKRGGKADC